MKCYLSAIAIAFIIISCSHGKTIHFPEGKDLNNPVKVTVIRNRNFNCGGQSTAILLDEMPIAYIRTGEYVSFFVESGVHYLRVRQNGVYGNFEKEKKYFFLISINFFDYVLRDPCGFEIEKISEEEGLKRIRNSKNLIETEEAPKRVAKATPTKSGPKKVPVTFDPEEPWTGKWRVEGHSTLKGIWAMKQSGTIVKSTKESYYEFKGKVRGNQLEGKLTGDYNQTQNIVITLSADGQSFKGFTRGAVSHQSGPINGKRE